MQEFMPLNHGFDEYFGLPYSNDMTQGNPKYDFDSIPLYDNTKVIDKNPDQDFLVKQYTIKAKDFIRKNKNNPFFLYVAHNMPHRPCHASRVFANKWFSGKELEGICGEEKETRDFLYPATIEELDWSTGEILKTLKELNIDSSTLVIFTSDNGPAIGSAGPLRGKKGSMYEGGLRVPCIMKWSGTIPEGEICKQIIASIDFYVTFAYLAGINLPDDRIIDGVNITDCLLGKTKAEPRKTFFYFNSRGLIAIRHKDWKLFPGEKPQLYNLQNDIGEKNNLAGEYPELVKQLTKKSKRFSEELENNIREPGQINI